jgi:hypothetical protein
MKRILLLTATAVALLLFSAPGARAFGVKDILKMNEDGIADSLIILKIENSGKTFHLDADDLHALRDAGVSDEVISVMLRTEGRDRDDYYDNGYYAYPYVHPYPYAYPYSRLYLGFGFHRYYSPYRHYYPYYGGYWARPYSRYPNSGDYGNQRYRGSYGSRLPAGGGPSSRSRK